MFKNRFNLTFFIVFFILLFSPLMLLISCSAAQDAVGDLAYSSKQMDAYDYEAMEDSAPEMDTRSQTEEGAPAGTETNRESQARRVIQRAYMDILVDSVHDTVDEVEGITEKHHGMISDSYVRQDGEDKYRGFFLLRVPQDRFRVVLQDIENLGEVTGRQVSSEDVTMKYLDLQARINSYQAREKRYVEILDVAENVEEILSVEHELDRIREHLESLEAQFKHLHDQVSYSFVELTLIEEYIPKDKIWTEPFHNFGNRLKSSLLHGLNIMLSIIAFLTTTVVFILPFALPVILFILLIRFMRDKKKSNKPTDMP